MPTATAKETASSWPSPTTQVLPPLERALRELDALAEGILGRSLRALIAEPERPGAPLMTDTAWAQASLGLVECALARALQALGVRPLYAAGHSYGELVALWQAQVLTDASLFQLTRVRGQLMREAGTFAPGGMLAIAADHAQVASLIARAGGAVQIANLNSPKQTIVAGSHQDLKLLAVVCDVEGVRSTLLKTAGAFHSAAMQPALAGFARALAEQVPEQAWERPQLPVIANLTAQPYPLVARDAQRILAEQLVSPVRWRDVCKSLVKHGANLFLEVGPGNVLSRTLSANVAPAACTALSSDPVTADARSHLIELIVRLHLSGVDVDLQETCVGLSCARPSAPVPLRVVKGGRPQTARPVSLEPVPRVANRMVSAVSNKHRALDQTVPLFLQDNNDVVREYLQLSARVLEAAFPAAEPGAAAQLATRFIELNSDVTARYLELQQDGIGWLRQHAELPAQLDRSQALSSQAAPVAAPTGPAPAIPAAPQPVTSEPAPRHAQPTHANVEPLAWLQGELSSLTGFPPEHIGSELKLEDLGIDSLAQATLLERIGKYAPNARQRARELSAAKTVGALAQAIAACTDSTQSAAPAAAAASLESALLAQLSHQRGQSVALDQPFDQAGVSPFMLDAALRALEKQFPALASTAWPPRAQARWSRRCWC